MISGISECDTVNTFITELKKRPENLKYVKKPPCTKGGRVWPSSMIGVRLDEGSKPDQS